LFTTTILCANVIRIVIKLIKIRPGRRDREHLVVGFITTYEISAYHH